MGIGRDWTPDSSFGGMEQLVIRVRLFVTEHMLGGGMIGVMEPDVAEVSLRLLAAILADAQRKNVPIGVHLDRYFRGFAQEYQQSQDSVLALQRVGA